MSVIADPKLTGRNSPQYKLPKAEVVTTVSSDYINHDHIYLSLCGESNIWAWPILYDNCFHRFRCISGVIHRILNKSIG